MNLIKHNYDDSDRIPYQSPIVTTYTSTELLELIGPIEAGSVKPNENNVLDGLEGAGYYAPEDDERLT